MRAFAGKTLRLSVAAIDDLDPSSAYVISVAGTEARGRGPLWEECVAKRPANCVEIVSSTATMLQARLGSSGGVHEVALSDEMSLRALFGQFRSAYLDVSGLPHNVWAPLMRAGLAGLDTFKVFYAEPSRYKKHASPTSKTEFDLSAGFRGIEPLPGFAKLRGPEDEKDAVFVALLGFEGKRAQHVALSLDPVPRVFAVIGVPGFRIEYPQVTHASNEDFLAEYRAHANVRLASASCPFEAYDVLADIQRDSGGKYMYIAPIGTKPHSIGAVCYALKHPGTTEIMYDHPVRKPGRTEGMGTIHIYTIKPSYVAS
jgi:hypothetical protein